MRLQTLATSALAAASSLLVGATPQESYVTSTSTYTITKTVERVVQTKYATMSSSCIDTELPHQPTWLSSWAPVASASMAPLPHYNGTASAPSRSGIVPNATGSISGLPQATGNSGGASQLTVVHLRCHCRHHQLCCALVTALLSLLSRSLGARRPLGIDDPDDEFAVFNESAGVGLRCFIVVPWSAFGAPVLLRGCVCRETPFWLSRLWCCTVPTLSVARIFKPVPLSVTEVPLSSLQSSMCLAHHHYSLGGISPSLVFPYAPPACLLISSASR